MAKSYFLSTAQEFGVRRNSKTIEFVGKGGFKETFRLVDQSNNEYALKIIDPNLKNSIRLDRELKILSKFDCPLISKLYEYGVFIDSTSESYYYIIEEFLGGGTLTGKLNSGITRDETIQLGIKLTEVLIYINSHNIVHRDIKPENILFRKPSADPVIVDFGIARDLNDISVTPTWQTSGPCSPFFASPEQLNNDKNLIDWRTDQFSLAVLLAICLTGNHPFWELGNTKDDIINKVMTRKTISKNIATQMNDLGFNLLIKMLEPWPHRRFPDPTKLLIMFKNLR